MPLNVCQVGHTTHDSKLVESFYGPFHIWQWENYQWQGAYCTGQDEVSKSIDINGYWEKSDTDRVRRILAEKPGLVIDLGAHIGWFVCHALSMGCDVAAIEADPENVRLMAENIDLLELDSDVAITTGWVHDQGVLDASYIDDSYRVRLLKIDIEGMERSGIDYTRKLWEDRLIDYALIEVSPIFENRESIMAPSYAELVDELRGYGYEAAVLKNEGDWIITGADCTFDQENVLFSRL